MYYIILYLWLIRCGHYWFGRSRFFAVVLVTYERGELFMTRSEITVHHDVAFGNVGSCLIEVKENGSLFLRRFGYQLKDDYNLNLYS